MNYYKATRPDGTDFYTGTVDYARAHATGEPITHPAKRRVKDDASTYLSVSIAPAGCTGMMWPCRLFRVEPIGRTLTSSDLPNKRACKALRVVEELPAWQALGPNGEAVTRHIERCKRITAEEAARLAAAVAAAGDVTLAAAWNAAWDAAWDAARNAAWGAVWGAVWGAAWGAARGAVWGAAWGAARGAARTAAVALVARDLITPEQFDALYGPWRSVMGDDE